MKNSKNSIYLVILLVLFLSLGCEENDSYSKTRVIENQTPFDVTIELFNEGIAFENLTIGANQTSEVTTECTYFISTEKCAGTVDWTFVSDSAVVIFDNSRKVTYCALYKECYKTNDKNITNLLDAKSYELKERKKKSNLKSQTYSYLITMNDYNNAVLINN